MGENHQYLSSEQQKNLNKSLETDLRPEYRRRIQIMLLANEGRSQAQICEILGCSQETARHWMMMAQTGYAHLWSEHQMGRPTKINEKYLTYLQELVKNSPRTYGYPFNRWTGQWLSQHLEKELGISLSACHVNRLLKKMGLSTRSQTTH